MEIRIKSTVFLLVLLINVIVGKDSQVSLFQSEKLTLLCFSKRFKEQFSSFFIVCKVSVRVCINLFPYQLQTFSTAKKDVFVR